MAAMTSADRLLSSFALALVVASVCGSITSPSLPPRLPPDLPPALPPSLPPTAPPATPPPDIPQPHFIGSTGEHHLDGSTGWHSVAACHVRQLFPLGGPFTGGTAVTVTGIAFQDLGDVKCRFGEDEVQALLANETTIECASPGCTSPTCVRGQEETHVTVPLEVSMNGVTFTGSGLQFTYYDMRYVAVSHITPAGGPAAGATPLLVRGHALRDLSSGTAMGVRLQGLKCKFGENDMVHAKLWAMGVGDRRDKAGARCVAPTDLTWPGGVGANASALHPMPLELTFNGYDTVGTLTSSRVSYTYYAPPAFNTSRLHPLGGPIHGGTELTVYLTDARLLVDLGGDAHGVFCRFTHTRTVGELGHERQHVVHEVVNASLTDCRGQRTCGAGWGAVSCRVPPLPPPLDTQLSPQYESSFDGRDVSVEVTVNGFDFTNGGLPFRYYDDTVWKLHRIEPTGGPLTGNTSLVARGLRFQPLGDVRCRFGPLNEEVNATIDEEHMIRCISPAHWLHADNVVPLSSQRVEVELTLNGQDYLPTRQFGGGYTYYKLDDAQIGLSVVRLEPPGGPEHGGTLVRVRGTGFDDVGGLYCKFGGELPVPASLIDRENVRCYSPQRTPTASSYVDDAFGGTYDERAVEVTINGQMHALTSSGVRFAYHTDAGVAVSRIYPRGGPRQGGTPVTVWGVGFRDLGHGRHTDVPTAAGLHCRFGGLELVPATLATGGGGGPQRLVCASPGLPAPVSSTNLVVRVTNNADNPPGGPALTDDDVAFTYYDSFNGNDGGRSTPYGATLLTHGSDWTGGDVL